MRTVFIAPSFLAVFAAAMLSLGWLVTIAGDTASPNLGAMPPQESFTTWFRNMPAAGPSRDSAAQALHERAQEIQLY